MQRFTPRGATLLALLALAACDAAPTASGPAADKPEDIRAMVQAMGFRGDLVQDFGSYVLVEGDIRITKDELRAAPRSASRNPKGPRFQYRTSNTVGSPKIQQIVVSLAGVAGTVWETPARDALAQWNAVSGSYVKMVEGSPADIAVSTTCTSSNVAAYASFPSGGNPGSTVYVNTCFGYTIGYSARLRNVVHELGHTIGFRHTNYVQNGETAGTDGAIQISGTPSSGGDGSSVMNGGTALNTWAGFSSYDQTATRALYPLPSPSPSASASGTGTVLVTWNSLPGASYYQVRRYETYREQNGYEGWQHESSSVYPWVTVYGTSYDTSGDFGGAWTGTSECYWEDGGYTERYNYYWYEVRAVFPNGTSAYSGWVGASDVTC
jgi:hypothetical protein